MHQWFFPPSLSTEEEALRCLIRIRPAFRSSLASQSGEHILTLLEIRTVQFPNNIDPLSPARTPHFNLDELRQPQLTIPLEPLNPVSSSDRRFSAL